MQYKVIDSMSINQNRKQGWAYEIPETIEGLILPNVLCDGALFQREKPIAVWGFAPAGSVVEIKLIKNETQEVVVHFGVRAHRDHSFYGEIPPLQASFDTYTLQIRNGEETHTVRDILIGELYLASGQSNMEIPVYGSLDYREIYDNATNPYLRFYNPPALPSPIGTAPFGYQLSPQNGANAWTKGDQGNDSALGMVSAIAYSAAVELFDRYKSRGERVPIGVLNLPIGGTIIAAWLPRRAMDEEFKKIVDPNVYSLTQETFETSEKDFNQFASLFNTKIAPVIPMNIRGVMWYQGESDMGADTTYYRAALQRLIQSWSEEFRYKDASLPFVMCQIAPWGNGTDNADYIFTPRFNEAFSDAAAQMPQTRSCVALYDVDLIYQGRNDSATIHPKVKTPIGKRVGMALWGIYTGESEQYFCPVVDAVVREGNIIKIRFKYVGEGLRSADGLPLRGFAVAGEDKKFYAAAARIVGKNEVDLTCNAVSFPIYATYAFCNMNMKSNLINSTGLPAVPFRSCKDEKAIYYDNHDFASCDFLQVWRFDLVKNEEYNAGWKNLYEGINADVLPETQIAVQGNSVKLLSKGERCSLRVWVGYPNDFPNFEKYRTLEFYLRKSDPSVRLESVRAIDIAGEEISLSFLPRDWDKIEAFVRFTVDLSGVARLKKVRFLEISFVNADNAVIYADSFELN